MCTTRLGAPVGVSDSPYLHLHLIRLVFFESAPLLLRAVRRVCRGMTRAPFPAVPPRETSDFLVDSSEQGNNKAEPAGPRIRGQGREVRGRSTGSVKQPDLPTSNILAAALMLPAILVIWLED